LSVYYLSDIRWCINYSEINNFKIITYWFSSFDLVSLLFVLSTLFQYSRHFASWYKLEWIYQLDFCLKIVSTHWLWNKIAWQSYLNSCETEEAKQVTWQTVAIDIHSHILQSFSIGCILKRLRILVGITSLGNTYRNNKLIHP